MKTLKQMKEAKQVGTIYHFTTIERLHDMIHQEHPFELKSHNESTISTTRNPQLPIHNKTFKDHGVRIALDGDKISEHHKVRPVAGLTDNAPDVLNHKHNDGYRVKRSSGEHEEAILHHPFNIKPYIKHIHIIKNRDTNDAVETHIVPKLKEHGIPYNHEKSFSFDYNMKKNLGEGFHNWNDCFEIILEEKHICQ